METKKRTDPKANNYYYYLVFNRQYNKVTIKVCYWVGKLEPHVITIIRVDETEADIRNKKVINRPDADEINAHIAEMFELLREPVINGDTETVKRIMTERLKYRKNLYRDRKCRDNDTEFIRPLADNITPEGHAIAQRIRERIASCCK